jgi:hypothetical protein
MGEACFSLSALSAVCFFFFFGVAVSIHNNTKNQNSDNQNPDTSLGMLIVPG